MILTKSSVEIRGIIYMNLSGVNCWCITRDNRRIEEIKTNFKVITEVAGTSFIDVEKKLVIKSRELNLRVSELSEEGCYHRSEIFKKFGYPFSEKRII